MEYTTQERLRVERLERKIKELEDFTLAYYEQVNNKIDGFLSSPPKDDAQKKECNKLFGELKAINEIRYIIYK